MAKLRKIIKEVDPKVIEEIKWRMATRPQGIPVWSHDGILCMGDLLKNSARLTFPKGAQFKDAKKLFNTRLNSTLVRGIDFFEDSKIDEPALKDLISQAIEVNIAKNAKH